MKRFFCPDCQREWVSAFILDDANKFSPRPWTIDDACPTCKCRGVQVVEFVPSFPGGDLPRLGTNPESDPYVDQLSHLMGVPL